MTVWAKALAAAGLYLAFGVAVTAALVRLTCPSREVDAVPVLLSVAFWPLTLGVALMAAVLLPIVRAVLWLAGKPKAPPCCPRCGQKVRAYWPWRSA